MEKTDQILFQIEVRIWVNITLFFRFLWLFNLRLLLSRGELGSQLFLFFIGLENSFEFFFGLRVDWVRIDTVLSNSLSSQLVLFELIVNTWRLGRKRWFLRTRKFDSTVNLWFVPVGLLRVVIFFLKWP